jgi:hypothetical protein
VTPLTKGITKPDWSMILLGIQLGYVISVGKDAITESGLRITSAIKVSETTKIITAIITEIISFLFILPALKKLLLLFFQQ